MDKYKAGNGTKHVKLTVDINTLGLAASRAIVIDLNSPAPGKSVAQSIDATGDIPKKAIGSAKSLQGKRLSVLTKIDLLGSDDERKKESERITAKYILDDGADGHVEFDKPTKTVHNNFTTVFLHKPIDLTT